MKLIVCLLFVGCVSAFPHDALKRASEDALSSFVSGMSDAPALHQALGLENTEEIKRFERDLKEDLAKYLREALDKALQKIKDAIEKGGEIHKEAFEKLKELREKMKDLNITDDEVAGKLLEELKSKVGGRLKEILTKLGILSDDEKRSVRSASQDIIEDINLRNIILRLKQMILEKMDAEAVKKSIAKFVENGSQRLCDFLSGKGKEKVLGFFDRLLDQDPEDRKKRSVSDVYEKLKEYFDNLDLDFKEKFSRFGEWVHEVLAKGLDKSKTRIENVKAIAKELVDKSKVISKDVATQALEYMKTYKEELGDLYDKVMEKLMKKIMEYSD